MQHVALFFPPFCLPSLVVFFCKNIVENACENKLPKLGMFLRDGKIRKSRKKSAKKNDLFRRCLRRVVVTEVPV